MKAVQVSVTARVHEASLTAPDQLDSVFCVADIEPSGPGRRQNQNSCPSGSSGASSQRVSWEEDLTFALCPSDRAQHLSLVLFRPAADSPGGHQYVAAGSLGLDPLLHMDAPSARHNVRVPVVDEVGKHAGEVSCTLSFSHRLPEARERAAAAGDTNASGAVDAAST